MSAVSTKHKKDAFQAYKPRNGWKVVAPCGRGTRLDNHESIQNDGDGFRIPFFGTLHVSNEPKYGYGLIRGRLASYHPEQDVVSVKEALMMLGVAEHKSLLNLIDRHIANLLGEARVLRREGAKAEAKAIEAAVARLEDEAQLLTDDERLHALYEAEERHQRREEKRFLLH
jgi:hypothetical protein